MPQNVKDALESFADNVIGNAKRELGTTKPRKTYSAKWRNGKLLSYQVKKKNRRTDNSGKLRESLSYEITEMADGYLLEISSLDYGVYVNEGREPGKGIPIAVLKKWIKTKPVRVQKGDGKGFAKQTNKAIDSLSFLINRKIKAFGIEANPFMTMSLERFQPELAESLEKEYAKEIADQIREKYSKNNLI